MIFEQKDKINLNKDISIVNQQKEEIVRSVIFETHKLISGKSDETTTRNLMVFLEIFCWKLPLKILLTTEPKELASFIKQRYSFIKQMPETAITISVTSGAKPESESAFVILECRLKNRPFIIDSLIEHFNHSDYCLSLPLYALLSVEYSEDKRLLSLQKGTDETLSKETYCCFILDNVERHEFDKIERETRDILEKVCCVVDDFPKMLQVVDDYSLNVECGVSESLMACERRRLFDWFTSGNAIFLGSGEFLDSNATSELAWENIDNPLGYIRRKMEMNDPTMLVDIGKLAGYFLESGLQINLIKTLNISEVHRRDKIQILFRKKKNSDRATRIGFFLILFTDRSLKEDALSIPLARLKVNSILDGMVEKGKISNPGGHTFKAALDFFDRIPKSELFRVDQAELVAMYEQFLHFNDYKQTQLGIYTQPNRRYAHITFCIPAHRFSRDVLDQIKKILCERIEIESEIDYSFQLGTNVYTHHIYWFPENQCKLDMIDLDLIERQVAHLTTTWQEEFQALLKAKYPDTFHSLEKIYDKSFDVRFQTTCSLKEAVESIEFIELLRSSGSDQVNLEVFPDRDESIVYIYSHNKYDLNDIMPLLQNMSLRVLDEKRFNSLVGFDSVYIYVYYVKSLYRQYEVFPDFTSRFCELLTGILEKKTENDVLNGLSLTAGLDHKQINLFILYRNYARQIGAPNLDFDKSLLENPDAVLALCNYFTLKFKPEANKKGLSVLQLNEIESSVQKTIDQVSTIAEDTVFRTILNLMVSTVRTNYFVGGNHSTIAIKVKCEMVEKMPSPRPLFEIYVHDIHMEGIHLRGGMIARGGIRHSDRPEDFRTEVLGLMNTQMIKNVVIIPEGSKGGFIVKQLPTDPAEKEKAVEEQYKIYIHALLSLTDNIVNGKVAPPQDVLRYDSDDYYLVVAADKGTALLSDTANEISAERKYWLKDAFASGGKNGYDHKKMAITAKGAWECVKLHFLEMGIDTQTDPISMIGIGDMSGDVFGNGLLLSKSIRLKGAFNHRHIFIDPAPNPESTWIERQRLFHLPNSAWTDFDKSLISSGGGVFERSAKSISLSHEMKRMLKTTVDTISGEGIIKLLLQCDVDLLWNGGVGTYVKASTEKDQDAGDTANDSVRINANQLRVKVIGEGGNLGLTHKARLEAAARGICLNTDAIDNSGGVDTSDREVNLKILLDGLMAEQQISSLEARNCLLEQLTGDIAELVLDNNRNQCRIISMDALRSKSGISPFLDCLTYLKEQNFVEIHPENLPSMDTWNENYNSELGILRPDLALLLSYTKMVFYQDLLRSDYLNDPSLRTIYVGYFSSLITQSYNLEKFKHPLHNEIIGTILVNRIINNAGITLLPGIQLKTACSPADVIVAYCITEQLLEADSIRSGIEDELADENLLSVYTRLIQIEEIISMLTARILNQYSSDHLGFSILEKLRSRVNDARQLYAKSSQFQIKHYRDKLEEKWQLSLLSPSLADRFIQCCFVIENLDPFLFDDYAVGS